MLDSFQAILASAFASRNYQKVMTSASRVLQVLKLISWYYFVGYVFTKLTFFSSGLILQLGLILGLVLAFLLFTLLPFTSRLFTDDLNVLRLVSIGIPVITQQL